MKKIILLSLFICCFFENEAQLDTSFTEFIQPVSVDGYGFKYKNVVIWSLGEDEIQFIPKNKSAFTKGKKHWELKAIDKLMNENRFNVQKIGLKISDIRLINNVVNKPKKGKSRKKNVFIGMAVGGTIGILLSGYTVRIIDDCDEDSGPAAAAWCGISQLFWGVGTIGAGIGLGAAFGSGSDGSHRTTAIRIAIPIKGKKSNYKKYKNQLRKHSIL